MIRSEMKSESNQGWHEEIIEKLAGTITRCARARARARSIDLHATKNVTFLTRLQTKIAAGSVRRIDFATRSIRAVTCRARIPLHRIKKKKKTESRTETSRFTYVNFGEIKLQFFVRIHLGRLCARQLLVVIIRERKGTRRSMCDVRFFFLHAAVVFLHNLHAFTCSPRAPVQLRAFLSK